MTLVPALQPVFVFSGTIPLSTRLAAAFLWVAALAPSWHYLETPLERRRPIPLLPLVGLLYGLYYALPIVLDAPLLNMATWINPHSDYQPAIEAAILGWVAILAGYGVFRRHRAAPWFQSVVPAEAPIAMWGARYLLLGLVVRLALETIPAAQIIGGLAGFLSSLVTFGLALLVMEWRRGRLTATFKAIAVAGFLAISLIEIGSGLLSPVVFILITSGLAFWAAAPTRLPLAAIAVLIGGALFVVTLKGVTEDFRNVTWSGDTTLSVTDRAELAGSLVRDQVLSQGASSALSTGSDAAIGRSSNSDLLAEIIRRTPSDVPYWNGETYLSLVGLLVPRLIWPDKPTKNLGQDFGHRYRFLGDTDYYTSFNLPWLVEAYANFGRLGILLIGIVIGAVYALLSQVVNVPGQSLWMTAACIVVTAPLLNIESDFSLTFGGIPLTLVALWAVLRLTSTYIPTRHRRAWVSS